MAPSVVIAARWVFRMARSKRRGAGELGRQAPGAVERIVLEPVTEPDAFGLRAVDPPTGHQQLERALVSHDRRKGLGDAEALVEPELHEVRAELGRR